MSMLAISTRIESSRLGMDEYGFMILADDIENISTCAVGRNMT